MNFEFHNPTRLVFGAGNVSRLGEIAGKYGKKALIVTGGGSVKKNGAFAKAVASLQDAGVSFAECSGIEPNPRITSVGWGAETARPVSRRLVSERNFSHSMQKTPCLSFEAKTATFPDARP